MKTFRKNLGAVALALLVIGGASACASKEKAAAGPGANRAAEANQASKTPNAQTDTEDLKRKQAEETTRLKKAGIDKLKEEEAAKIAAANALAAEKLAKAYFDFDNYEIKQDYRNPLARDAARIKEHSAENVVVEGHCDERGSEKYNLALGERRAAAVKHYLVSLGVSEKQLQTISYGSERPANNGHDEASWSQNRRVQFSQE